MQRSEGEWPECGDNRRYGDKLMLYREIGTNAGRLDQATRKSKRKWDINNESRTVTRGKSEVEEVEDAQLHVRGSSKIGKSCTKPAVFQVATF